MLRRMLVCTLLWPVFLLPAYGEDTTKPVGIHELDSSMVFGGILSGKKVFLGKAPDRRAALCKGRSREKPEVIRSEMMLSEIFDSETIQDRIASQVDFAREQLVLFAWTGRSGERMSAAVKKSDDESTVVFYELPRVGDGFATIHHVQMYVIGKDAKWSLGPAPEGVE